MDTTTCCWCEEEFDDNLIIEVLGLTLCSDCNEAREDCGNCNTSLDSRIEECTDGRFYCSEKCLRKNQEDEAAGELPGAIATMAEEHGYNYNEVYELIEENLNTNGSLSSGLTIDMIDEVLDWVSSDVENKIKIAGIASNRHNNTDYDAMLAEGINRDLARELIKN